MALYSILAGDLKVDDTLDRMLNSQQSKWESANLLKAYKTYPKPELKVGDIFVSNCDSSVSRWDGITQQMIPGDTMLVVYCIPITRFDGSLVENEDGPHWCYMFKNLTTGVEFEMQGTPAKFKVIPRSEASEALYE